MAPWESDQDKPLSQRQRVGRQEDRARQRHLLHSRSEMRRLAHGRVVHVKVATDGTDDDLAGVQADSNVDRDTLAPSSTLGVSLHCLLHPKRRIASPHRMIFVGDRCAEQRHDPVAHDLVHRALIVMDGLHHPLKDRVENRPRLLGIAVCEQLHRPSQIGEEHGHVLALTLQGAPGREDFLGEVLRRVSLWRGETRLGRRIERGRAPAAELVVGGIACSARRTDTGKRRGALTAEPHPCGILRAAARTRHRHLQPARPIHGGTGRAEPSARSPVRSRTSIKRERRNFTGPQRRPPRPRPTSVDPSRVAGRIARRSGGGQSGLGVLSPPPRRDRRQAHEAGAPLSAASWITAVSTAIRTGMNTHRPRPDPGHR